MNYCFPSSAGADLVREAEDSNAKGARMTCAERLATFVCHSAYEDLSDTAREQLKIRILDSVGCAVGALEGEPVQILRRQIGELEPEGKCTLIGSGASTPDSAAFYNHMLAQPRRRSASENRSRR